MTTLGAVALVLSSLASLSSIARYLTGVSPKIAAKIKAWWSVRRATDLVVIAPPNLFADEIEWDDYSERVASEDLAAESRRQQKWWPRLRVRVTSAVAAWWERRYIGEDDV